MKMIARGGASLSTGKISIYTGGNDLLGLVLKLWNVNIIEGTSLRITYHDQGDSSLPLQGPIVADISGPSGDNVEIEFPAPAEFIHLGPNALGESPTSVRFNYALLTK